jgi:hypothetical protein
LADEDIGGIKVGLTADMTQLEAALQEADRLISGKAQKLRDRQITMNVYAKVDNATFGKIERDLNTVVKRAQERNAFKFRPVFEVTRGSIASFNRDMIRQARQSGGFKVPIVPEFNAQVIADALRGQEITVPVKGEWTGWLGSQIPEVVVNVRGHFVDWDEEGGPEVSSGGGGGRPRTGGGGAARRTTGTNVTEPPSSSAHVQQQAEATGSAVASKLQEAPVKTEKAPKEKAEEKTAVAAAAPVSRPAAGAGGFLRCPSCKASVNPNFWDEHQQKHVATPVAAAAPVTAAAAAPVATEAKLDAIRDKVPDEPTLAERATGPRSDTARKTAREAAKEVAGQARETAEDAGRIARARVSNITQQMARGQEMPGASPLPETTGDQAVCPWCHQVFKVRGLPTHIRAAHADQTQGLTPGGYNREELARARAQFGGRGIAPATRESGLIRQMFEQNREIGEVLPTADFERVVGLIEKGLDPDAMAMGLLQPMAELSEEKQQNLLQDPEFQSLQRDFDDAIEARRAGLKAEFAEELDRVAQNPERSEFRLDALRGAIEDPTAGYAHEIGARRARRARREELGVSPEALSGFRMRDVVAAATPGGATEVPEGYEELIRAYAQGEAAGRDFDRQQTAEMDKSLLAYKTPEGKWDFGPDMDRLRAAMGQALEEPTTVEGWMSRAETRGVDSDTLAGMQRRIAAQPHGERGEVSADVMAELREMVGGPDPRLLEDVRRLAFGPAPGEDIGGIPEGDPRRTGMVPRIRRAAIKSSRNPEAQRLRFGALFDPNRPLRRIRPREMEVMEATGIGAQASALLDIIDQRRNQEQSTAQAADTREANQGTIPENTVIRRHLTGAPDTIRLPPPEPPAGRIRQNPAEIRENAARRRREKEAIDRVRQAEQARVSPPPEPEAETIIDISEIAPQRLSEEDRAALRVVEETKPATCLCGWEGAQGQFQFHTRGTRHKNWQQSMRAANPATPPESPGFSGAYNPVYQQGEAQSALEGMVPSIPNPTFGRSATPPTRSFADDESIGRARAEAINISEDQPDVTVPGATPAAGPSSKRWCQVCARPISNSQWNRHIGGQVHRRNMDRTNRRTRAVLEEAGLPIDPDVNEINRRQVEEAIQQPPPALGMASVGLAGLSTGERRDLKMIASTASGRRQLREQGWDVDEILGAKSARNPEAEATPPEDETPVRKSGVRQSEIKNLIGSEEVDRIRQQIGDETQTILEQSTDIKQEASAVLKENPVRALSVAVGQVLVQTVGGRSKLEAQIKDLNRAVGREQQLVKRAGTVRSSLVEAQTALQEATATGDEEMVSRLEEEIPRRREILERAEKAAERQREEVVAPQAEAVQAGRRRFALTTLGVGTVGIVAGTALFTTAMTAFNTIMEQATAWVGRATDELSGFASQTNALAKDLASASLQTGRTEGTIRQRMGIAGIGGEQADMLATAIAPRITGEIASQRSEMMRDTLMLGLQGIMDRVERPDIENFRGVFQPTGGMVLPIVGQTNIGAQASVQEQIARTVGSMPSNTLFDWMNADARGPREFLAPLGDLFGAGTSDLLKAQDEGVRMVMGTLTDAVARGGGTARFVNPTTQIDQRDLLAEQGQAQILDMMGASPDLTNQIRSGDIALVDANGQIIRSQKELAAAFDDLARGLQRVDLEQYLKAGARQLEGALFGIAANLKNQLGTWNPIASAMQLAQQPLTPFGMGVQTSVVDPSFLAQRQGVSQDLRQQINMREIAGVVRLTQQATNMPSIGRDPADLLNTYSKIRGLGQDIVGWQKQIADMQLHQGMVEYNRQVFVAQRSISDLRGLVNGASDAEASWLGIAQKKQLARQREIQDIQRVGEAESLAMNQRQINVQKAIAGFATPGMSPGEAAAQVKQAQFEADYAQRQQDRNQETYRITGEMIPDERKIVDESNLRQLQDALAEFQLFQDRFTLDQETALIAQNIADAQAAQAILAQDMQAMLGALQQLQQTETSMIVDAFNQGSDTLQDTADAVKKVFSEVSSDFARNFNITISARRRGSRYDPASTDPYSSGRGHSFGFLGNVSGATSMIVGEAGTETVAVLRNPRKVAASSGGGGNVFVLNINNPTVRNDTDIEEIARKVQQIYSRQTRLLGL